MNERFPMIPQDFSQNFKRFQEISNLLWLQTPQYSQCDIQFTCLQDKHTIQLAQLNVKNV